MDMSPMVTIEPMRANREPAYLFARKAKFSASRKLSERRSDSFVKPRPVPDNDIWKRKPPDFSVKLYRSLQLQKPPTEKEEREREASGRVRFLETVNELCKLRDELFPDLIGKREPPKLLTRFPHIGPYEASLMFVKDGKYPSSAYKNPKPHDFRQYETGIPDFVTSFTKDPSNLKLKLQALPTDEGLPPLNDKHTVRSFKKFTTFQPQDPKWDSKLVLPNCVYPPKSASYSRHRRRRGAYSALLDRVEEKLTKTWQEMDTVVNV